MLSKLSLTIKNGKSASNIVSSPNLVMYILFNTEFANKIPIDKIPSIVQPTGGFKEFAEQQEECAGGGKKEKHPAVLTRFSEGVVD